MPNLLTFTNGIAVVAAGAAVLSCASACAQEADFFFFNGKKVGDVTVSSTLKALPSVKLPKAIATKECATNGICQTPLLVTQGGEYGGVWNKDGCSVYWPYFQIRVPAPMQPTLRWVLVKDPSDTATYSFENSGIDLQPTPGDETDQNDRTQDMNRPSREAGGQAFGWNSVHKRKKKIWFVPLVYRTKADGSKDIACKAGDPVVFHDN